MKYLYFFLAGLLSLGLLYNVFGIGYLKWVYHQAENPKADFQIIESEKPHQITIVDFTSYQCGYCKQAHELLTEAFDVHQDVRYIVRPIEIAKDPDAEAKQEPNDLVKLTLAAGLQGKFQELHDAFMDYPEFIIPEELIQETATLYGIDYEKMVEDSKSDKVQKYLDDNLSDMLGAGVQTIPAYLIGKNIYTVTEDMPDLKDFLTMITNEKR